ncbi:hypothetical protein GOODEAATRI_011164 [Goodea atripinnis]|uniref:Uncharacterized protein n=1 Tax=Goodea atripinnis TaxID=208336 RepID=A0ABV0N0J5_9TELE
MAQINSCLKRTFIGFNFLFAIIGGIIIGLAVLSQILTSAEEDSSVEGRGMGLIVLYIMGTVTMLLGLLGAFGAYKEQKLSLVVFLVCMVIGAFLMIRGGIPAAIARPQVTSLFLHAGEEVQQEHLTGNNCFIFLPFASKRSAVNLIKS